MPRYYVIPKRVVEAHDSGAFAAPVEVAQGMEDDDALAVDDEGQDRVVMSALDHTLLKDPAFEDNFADLVEVRLFDRLRICVHRL